MGVSVKIATSIHDDDIIYINLPMYHTSAMCLGVGQLLLTGSTVALRRKFSASQYWNDCIKYRCTVSTYKSYDYSQYL